MPIQGLRSDSSLIRNGFGTNRAESNLRQSFTVSSNRDSDSVSVSSRPGRESGSVLDVSLAKSNAEIASNAAESIISLRADQLELAEQAANSSNPTTRSDLQSEIETLQAEIERIASEAVDQNGNSVLTGSGTTLSNGEVVQLADISAIRDDPNVDVSSESGADDAVESLTATLQSSRVYRESSSSSLGRAESVLATELATERTTRSEDNDAIAEISEAEQVAKDISASLLQEFGNTEDPATSLTSTLLSGELNADVLLD